MTIDTLYTYLLNICAGWNTPLSLVWFQRFVNIHHGNLTRSEDPLRGAAKAPFPSHSNLASKLTESLKSVTPFSRSWCKCFSCSSFTLCTRNMHANIIFSCRRLEHMPSHAYQFMHCFNLMFNVCIYTFQIMVRESKFIACKDACAQFYQLTTKLISIIYIYIYHI